MQGSTQSAVTAVAGQLMANQYILDVSNEQFTWYGLKDGTTLTANPAAPTTGTMAGWTFTNGNVIVCLTDVDALGGESKCANETTHATGGTTNGITVTSPAASAGAVGYKVYITAVGVSSGTEVNHTNAANCGGALTLLETVNPACPIGTNFVALASS